MNQFIVEKKELPDIILKKENKSTIQTDKIISIGASTGGVQALEELIKNLPKTTPGILIVQHMPSGFTHSFASRLDSLGEIEVKEAEVGDEVQKGKAFVAVGDKHLLIRREGKKYFIRIDEGEKVSRHRPSVDILFRSAANEAGENTVAVILTGMGDDGSIGIQEVKDRGGLTIAQDEESSVVFGMPKEAIDTGKVDEVLSLEEIREKISQIK